MGLKKTFLSKSFSWIMAVSSLALASKPSLAQDAFKYQIENITGDWQTIYGDLKDPDAIEIFRVVLKSWDTPLVKPCSVVPYLESKGLNCDSLSATPNSLTYSKSGANFFALALTRLYDLDYTQNVIWVEQVTRSFQVSETDPKLLQRSDRVTFKKIAPYKP